MPPKKHKPKGIAALPPSALGPQRALQPLEAMLHQGLLPDVITYLRQGL